MRSRLCSWLSRANVYKSHHVILLLSCISFAVVIQQLPSKLRDAICIFYLVLRGLDTVEDDMAIPEAVKVPELLRFHEHSYEECVLREREGGGDPSERMRVSPTVLC